MQENNFFFSALQPEAGVCSLALPSDQQLDRKSKVTQDAALLKSARVQEQVRMRMLQNSQAANRANGTEGKGRQEGAGKGVGLTAVDRNSSYMRGTSQWTAGFDPGHCPSHPSPLVGMRLGEDWESGHWGLTLSCARPPQVNHFSSLCLSFPISEMRQSVVTWLTGVM